MTRLIAFYGGWALASDEVDLWHFLARAFKVDEVVMVPGAGLRHKAVTESPGIADALRDARADGYTIVNFHEDGTTALPDFAHPEDAAYVFGPSGRSPTIEADEYVHIPTPDPRGLLWGHQAAAIGLYDREVKA